MVMVQVMLVMVVVMVVVVMVEVVVRAPFCYQEMDKMERIASLVFKLIAVFKIMHLHFTSALLSCSSMHSNRRRTCLSIKDATVRSPAEGPK